MRLMPPLQLWVIDVCCTRAGMDSTAVGTWRFGQAPLANVENDTPRIFFIFFKDGLIRAHFKVNIKSWFTAIRERCLVHHRRFPDIPYHKKNLILNRHFKTVSFKYNAGDFKNITRFSIIGR